MALVWPEWVGAAGPEPGMPNLWRASGPKTAVPRALRATPAAASGQRARRCNDALQHQPGTADSKGFEARGWGSTKLTNCEVQGCARCWSLAIPDNLLVNSTLLMSALVGGHMEPKSDWVLIILLAGCLFVSVTLKLRHPTHCSYLHRACPNGLHARTHI